MKFLYLPLLLLMAGCVCVNESPVPQEKVEPMLQKAGFTVTYPGWKLKALSFSYDDGNVADRRLVGIFNKYGMKGTFHIPSGWLKKKPKNRVTEKEINTLYRGHEISGHGANHLVMSRLKSERIARELDSEIKEWQRITGKRIRGYAYPYGRYSDEVIKALKQRGYLYARPVRGVRNFDLPKDFLMWSPHAHHNGRIDRWAKRYLDYKPTKLSVLLIWGHSYEFPQKNNWEVMENFCKTMSSRKDIYYATMADIASYAHAARSLQFYSCCKKVKNVSGQKIYFTYKGKKLTLEPGEKMTL